MSKITLNSIASLDTIGAATTINTNMTTIQTAMDNTLSRDGTSPNQMAASLDMNSNRILNLPAPAQGTEPLRVQDLGSYTISTTGQLITPVTTVVGDVALWGDTVGKTLTDGGVALTASNSVVLSNKTIDTAAPNTIKINGNPLTASSGSATITVPNQTGTLLSTAGNVLSTGFIANPAGTSSTSFIMLGLGSAAKFTPKFSTRAIIVIVGTISVTGGAGAYSQLMFGTGSAPAYGAAQTGTYTGVANQCNSPSIIPCMWLSPITGLTPNTQYWFDISLETLSGGFTATIGNCSAFAWEL